MRIILVYSLGFSVGFYKKTTGLVRSGGKGVLLSSGVNEK